MADSSTLPAILLLWVSTLAFAIFYYLRLRAVSAEYSEARRIVEGIVTTFKVRYDTLSSGLQQLKAQISTTQLKAEESVESTAQLNERITETLGMLEQFKRISQGMLDNMSTLNEEVKVLKEAQGTLQSEVSSLSRAPRLESPPAAPKEDSPPKVDARITETENIVLKYLLSEGPKTARQVEVKIGKTREHTARLMKKLWQEGYVERETHKTPFTYRVAAALRDLESPPT